MTTCSPVLLIVVVPHPHSSNKYPSHLLLSNRIIVYFLVLLSALTLGFFRWKKARKADRLLVILLISTTLHESLSALLIVNERPNMPNFHVYSPLELLITSWYFRESTTLPWLKKAATIAGIAGVATSIANTLWLQPIETMNSNFLLFEATAIIILSLLSFYNTAICEEVSPFVSTQFWVTVCLLMYWSFSFATYGMRGLLKHVGSPLHIAVETVLAAANLLFYAGLALIFIFYTRLRPSGE